MHRNAPRSRHWQEWNNWVQRVHHYNDQLKRHFRNGWLEETQIVWCNWRLAGHWVVRQRFLFEGVKGWDFVLLFWREGPVENNKKLVRMYWEHIRRASGLERRVFRKDPCQAEVAGRGVRSIYRTFWTISSWNWEGERSQGTLYRSQQIPLKNRWSTI